jgi:hypothetical protein
VITLTGQRRRASGTGAEAAPEILETPDGRRLGTPPRSVASRLAGGVGGAVAGGAVSRALRPVARRVARRFGLPAGVVVRGVDIVAPLAFSLVMNRLARRRARAKAGTATTHTFPDEPPGPVPL